MTNTWPLPWRISAAIARESGLDWARWAYGETKPRPFWPGASEADRWERDPVTPVPDPSDAEAYRADCARRGVEPGPMPALSWEGEGESWVVTEWTHAEQTEAEVYIGEVHASVWSNGDVFVDCNDRRTCMADLTRAVALATAAARAMGVG